LGEKFGKTGFAKVDFWCEKFYCVDAYGCILSTDECIYKLRGKKGWQKNLFFSAAQFYS
jgi:hypothetical protein